MVMAIFDLKEESEKMVVGLVGRAVEGKEREFICKEERKNFNINIGRN